MQLGEAPAPHTRAHSRAQASVPRARLRLTVRRAQTWTARCASWRPRRMRGTRARCAISAWPSSQDCTGSASVGTMCAPPRSSSWTRSRHSSSSCVPPSRATRWRSTTWAERCCMPRALPPMLRRRPAGRPPATAREAPLVFVLRGLTALGPRFVAVGPRRAEPPNARRQWCGSPAQVREGSGAGQRGGAVLPCQHEPRSARPQGRLRLGRTCRCLRPHRRAGR